MSLDAPRTDAELIALATCECTHLSTAHFSNRGPCTVAGCRCRAFTRRGRVVAKAPPAVTAMQADLQRQLGVLQLHQRLGDTFRLVLGIAPRTKKNSTTLGIRQKKAYRTYRDAIIRALEPLRLAQLIPLPEREYNIAARYYVDRRGELADKCGLDQGLYDALENAGVVTDDWQFRTDDGTRIIPGDSRPRVELVITPLT